MVGMIRDGATVDDAVEKMANQYELSDRQVKRIYSSYGKPLLRE